MAMVQGRLQVANRASWGSDGDIGTGADSGSDGGRAGAAPGSNDGGAGASSGSIWQWGTSRCIFSSYGGGTRVSSCSNGDGLSSDSNTYMGRLGV